MFRIFRTPAKYDGKVHLGPGQSNYLPGWLNIDANMFTGKCDLWADLRFKLPFHDQSINCFYSHHVIEHLPDIRAHFKDVFRCLKKTGVYRLAGPNGDSAIAKFVSEDRDWFSDYPQCRRSIGGRFENFIFCKGEHLTILTTSFLKELLEDAGFTEVRICMPTKETDYEEYFSECLEKEYESDFMFPHTLVIEAKK